MVLYYLQLQALSCAPKYSVHAATMTIAGRTVLHAKSIKLNSNLQILSKQFPKATSQDSFERPHVS